jgi:HTH-type transcriptional regulator / antitoxin HipB
MTKAKGKPTPQFGRIRNAAELGALTRAFRKNQQLTLEKVSGLINISMRFLSEFERGKETAEVGKVLETLDRLGLEVIVQPRGYDKKWQDPQNDQ